MSDIAIYPQKSAPATVISLNETSVSTQIAARIEAIPVRVGEVVEKGAVLAQLDCTDYRLTRDEATARLESLKARIELAERRLRRTEKLTMNQTVSEELLDERESDLAVLRADHRGTTAELQRSKVQVSRCVLNSPFRAVITKRVSSVGEFADVGTPVVDLMDVEELEISAQVPIQDIDQLKNVSELYFEDSARRYALKLRTVVPTVNTTTRNREVRLLFMNGPALPGAAGKLVWQDQRPHVPGKLLVRRGNVFGVFTSDQGLARFHKIDDAQQGRASAVTLSPDTFVITEGQFSLQDSQKIKETN